MERTQSSVIVEGWHGCRLVVLLVAVMVTVVVVSGIYHYHNIIVEVWILVDRVWIASVSVQQNG